ncbi:MAG: hypothetical protein R3E39_05510 [Anaerolineae bacterium]
MDATSGAVTLDLPAVDSYSNQVYTVVKTELAGTAMPLVDNASKTINGATTHALANQYFRVAIISDSTHSIVLW